MTKTEAATTATAKIETAATAVVTNSENTTNGKNRGVNMMAFHYCNVWPAMHRTNYAPGAS